MGPVTFWITTYKTRSKENLMESAIVGLVCTVSFHSITYHVTFKQVITNMIMSNNYRVMQ